MTQDQPFQFPFLLEFRLYNDWKLKRCSVILLYTSQMGPATNSVLISFIPEFRNSVSPHGEMAGDSTFKRLHQRLRRLLAIHFRQGWIGEPTLMFYRSLGLFQVRFMGGKCIILSSFLHGICPSPLQPPNSLQLEWQGWLPKNLASPIQHSCQREEMFTLGFSIFSARVLRSLLSSELPSELCGPPFLLQGHPCLSMVSSGA